jgi:hypothetical protein
VIVGVLEFSVVFEFICCGRMYMYYENQIKFTPWASSEFVDRFDATQQITQHDAVRLEAVDQFACIRRQVALFQQQANLCASEYDMRTLLLLQLRTHIGIKRS